MRFAVRILFLSLHLFLYYGRVQRMTFQTGQSKPHKGDELLGVQRMSALTRSLSVMFDACAIMTQHLAQECTNVRAIMTQHLAQGCTKVHPSIARLFQSTKHAPSIRYYRYC